MRGKRIIIYALAAGFLTGCADTSDTGPSGGSSSTSALSPAIIPTPTNPDNPPVTMSGYMDTSVTSQSR